MKSVNIHEAKTNLSRLVAEAAKGGLRDHESRQTLVKVVPLTRLHPAKCAAWASWRGASRCRTTSIEWERRKSPAFSARGREVSSRHPHPALGRQSVRQAVTQDATVLGDPDNILVFSTASLWEIVIKRQQRDDFAVDPRANATGFTR